MHWIHLLIAGFLEIIWVISLKYTEGFTKLVPTICYAISGLGSAYFLSLSVRVLPMGTAYTIWMGIGIIGAVGYDLYAAQRAMNTYQMIFMLLIIIGISGLKVSTTR